MDHLTHGIDLVQRLRELRIVLKRGNRRTDRRYHRPEASPEFSELDIKLIDTLLESYTPDSSEHYWLRLWRRKIIALRSSHLRKKTPSLPPFEMDHLELVIQSHRTVLTTNHRLSHD